ncbi:MAG: DUF5916 domain-containing protein [Calditrichaeota bacterium]|nr:DUF5916 domain-containing protein [Calditrichota bacterium]
MSSEQSKRLEVDGLLAEGVWQQAVVASNFKQRDPEEGQLATEQTEVRILYDSETLYIGVLARDTQPDKIIARILQRDRLMQQRFSGRITFQGDDAVAILLDPFHDQKNGMVFATNPNGAEFEALVTDEGREFNVDWRTVWKVASKRIPEGWSAEFAIPFRSLRYPKGADDQPWGINIFRIVQRKNEESLWRAWSRDNEGFERVSRAGHLYGMVDLPRTGINLEVKPFGLTGIVRERNEDPNAADIFNTEHKLNSGFDAKWELRPGLLLDLTYNTDFAQAEVDDEQVNLTRFDLFFPEKRDFFLENAGIFEYGSRAIGEPPPFLLFFSRRIGIADADEDGDGDEETVEIPVFGGARLTGRVGKQTIGLLNMTTESAFGVPSTNYAVARVKRDIGSNNYIGLMATDKRSSDFWNSTAGVDWSLWPSKALNLQGFVARTFTRGDGGDDTAYRLGIDFTTERFGVSAQHITIGPETNAELGFITREDIRRTDGFARFTTRPTVFGLRSISNFVSGQHIVNLNGEIRDWSASVGAVMSWSAGHQFGAFLTRSFTRLDEDFTLGSDDDVEVAVGDYDANNLFWFSNTSNSNALVLGSSGTYSQFYGGTLLSVRTFLRRAFGSNFSLILQHSHNHIKVPNGGELTAEVAGVRLQYAFSTKLFANALLQYNSDEEVVSANIRLNYIHRPGSDFFLVFNEQEESIADRWRVSNRGVVLKLTYLRRI